MAIDSCFALLGARQYGAITRENSDEKYLSPNLELSTPTESSYTACLLGGKSSSVKLVSRKESKGLAKTILKNMDRTMQNYSISVSLIRAKVRGIPYARAR